MNRLTDEQRERRRLQIIGRRNDPTRAHAADMVVSAGLLTYGVTHATYQIERSPKATRGSKHLSPYVIWAKTHNSLLVVTFDEDDNTAANLIPTIFVGPMVKAGKYGEQVTHYRVLRTLDDAFGLGHLGASAAVAPITDVW